MNTPQQPRRQNKQPLPQDAKPPVRVKRPERRQVQWRDASLDQLVPQDHRVRLVWAYVEAIDTRPLYQSIQAVEGGVGRDAVDPRILLALWMFATIEGVSSARHLARLCERDVVYQWICGEVGVNYHLLADFRAQQGAFLEQLLTDTIATLLQQNLITLETVAQDGMRVRASAGSSSFRRQKTLEKCREEAAAHLQQLRNEDDDHPAASQTRQRAAADRAARERAEQVAAALQQLAELQAQKEERKKGTSEDARCSTTDPEARRIKMANGGFQPAYNVQFATTGETRLIVAVAVTNNGSDGGQLATMHTTLSHAMASRHVVIWSMAASRRSKTSRKWSVQARRCSRRNSMKLAFSSVVAIRMRGVHGTRMRWRRFASEWRRKKRKRFISSARRLRSSPMLSAATMACSSSEFVGWRRCVR